MQGSLTGAAPRVPATLKGIRIAACTAQIQPRSVLVSHGNIPIITNPARERLDPGAARSRIMGLHMSGADAHGGDPDRIKKQLERTALENTGAAYKLLT